MNPVLVAIQVTLLALANAPHVAEPARGALLLGSLFFFGAAVGARLGRAWSEREERR